MKKTFEAMDKNQKCLLVGKVAKKYDEGFTIDEIATIIRKPKELVRYVVDCVLTARECGENGSYPWGCGD